MPEDRSDAHPPGTDGELLVAGTIVHGRPHGPNPPTGGPASSEFSNPLLARFPANTTARAFCVNASDSRPQIAEPTLLTGPTRIPKPRECNGLLSRARDGMAFAAIPGTDGYRRGAVYPRTTNLRKDRYAK